MHKILKILIGFHCLAFILSGCTSQPPKIVQEGIERVGPGGSGFQNPVWSPDGTKIAVTTRTVVHSWTSEIFVLDVSTGKKKSIMYTDNGSVTAVSWSPDGSQILLASQNGGDWPEAIWTLDAEGESSPEFLTNGYDAAWSPDGKSVALFSLSRGNSYWNVELSVFDIETRMREIILEDKPVDVTIGGIKWSPDGKNLIFGYGTKDYIDPPRFEHVDIYILEISTKKVRKITDQGENDFPSWNSNGSLIAYTTQIDKGRNTILFIADKNNNCRQKLFEADELWRPSWSPDGEHIAFGSHGEVYLLTLDKFPEYKSVCP